MPTYVSPRQLLAAGIFIYQSKLNGGRFPEASCRPSCANSFGGTKLALEYKHLPKPTWYWQKNRQVGQWNTIKKKTEINLHTYGHWIFDKEAKTIQRKRESIFNKWCWSSWMSTYRKMQIQPYLSACSKLKYKWTKELNLAYLSNRRERAVLP